MTKEIAPLELFERLKKESFYLVDVREEDEYALQHIEGSVLHPLSRFNHKEIKHDLPIIFICRSGNRSKRASDAFLSKHPEATSYNLTGGLIAWNSASLPVINKN